MNYTNSNKDNFFMKTQRIGITWCQAVLIIYSLITEYFIEAFVYLVFPREYIYSVHNYFNLKVL